MNDQENRQAAADEKKARKEQMKLEKRRAKVVKKLSGRFKRLEKATRISIHELFRDFCTYAMAWLHNWPYTVDDHPLPTAYEASFEELENACEAVLVKYIRKGVSISDQFWKIFAVLKSAAQADPYDYIRHIYQTIFDTANRFDPIYICRAITTSFVHELCKDDDGGRLCLPSCQSNLTVIIVDTFRLNFDKGEDEEERLYAKVAGSNPVCAQMAYINRSLIGFPARMILTSDEGGGKKTYYDTPDLQLTVKGNQGGI